MGFFIFLKDYKSYNAFTNFCFNSYKDDFYIPVPARLLKAGPIRFNISKKGIPKPGFHRIKDRQRSEISKGVNIGDNGFKDLSSWESTEEGFYMSEDKFYKPVES